MIKISAVKTDPFLGSTQEEIQILRKKAAQILKIHTDEVKQFRIEKKSIDARKKQDIKLIYTLVLDVTNEAFVLKKCKNKNVTLYEEHRYMLPDRGNERLGKRPVIVGMGPAGLICGYMLAKNGYAPVILERGEDVDTRSDTVNHFWNTGELNVESNVQFGEGGAGTFSDGKLNTQIKDPSGRIRYFLELFVSFGANPKILYEQKPHVGTDQLKEIIKGIRNEIIQSGGEIRFNSKVTDIQIECNKITGVKINNEEIIATDDLILAIGHSARDTFQMLYQKGIPMEAKDFAVGFRVQHKQDQINLSQYGEKYASEFPAAPYKLTAKTEDLRGVFTFCMCPGGYVVNASSEPGRLAVNGMSYSGRDGKNANSAVIISVNKEDYKKYITLQHCENVPEALSGLCFQQKLEEAAYQEGNGAIPIQLYGDFKNNVISKGFGSIMPEIKGTYHFGNLRRVLPDFLQDSFIEGMEKFGYNLKGFASDDAILAGIESRTSSPIRIPRNEGHESIISGLYPIGEGAGYAGGITSAAVDGIKTAEKIISKYAKWE